MRRKVAKKDTTYVRFRCWVCVKRVCLFLLVLMCGILIFIPFTKTFVDELLGIIVQISCHSAYDVIMPNIWIVYIVLGIVFLIMSCWLYRKISSTIFPDCQDYNAEYLEESLTSNNRNLPATSRKDLLKKVAGDKKLNQKYERMITEYIDQNIEPVKEFLANSNENVLIIESPWGSGKTTTLLIAVNEYDRSVKGYKYVYESAFKYTSGLSEYFRDILEVICQISNVYGIKIKTEMRDLLENMSFDLPKMILKMVSVRSNVPTLSSGMIFKINEKARRKNLRIVVILDDLDRLSGEDIVRTLSFLSMIRRLEFVKVILPLDSNAVIGQLNNIVYQPKQFIQKYLPDQTSLRFKSGYEMVENVAIAVIKEKMKLKDNQLDLCYPIWEATLLLMISRRIRGELDPSREYKYPWLTFERIRQDDNNLEWLHGVVLTILNAPHYASVHVKNVFANSIGIGRDGYSWEAINGANIRQFQHIIWRLRRINRSNSVYVRDNFTEEDYEKVVASWVRDYARDNWALLGFSLRDVINTIDGERAVEVSNVRGESFVNAFNTFFPQSPLKYSVSGDMAEK